MSMQGGRMQNKSTSEKLYTALGRAVKLFVIGILTQAGTGACGESPMYFYLTSPPDFPTYDLKHLRIMGILQRVALCYLTAALVEIWSPLEPDAADATWPPTGWAAHKGVCGRHPMRPLAFLLVLTGCRGYCCACVCLWQRCSTAGAGTGWCRLSW